MSLLAIPSGTSSNAGGFYPYEIEQSLRFNDGDSAYLTHTPPTEGDRDTWTWSCWFKIGVPATQMSFFGGYANANDRDTFRLESNGTLSYQLIHSGNTDNVTTDAVFRDHSAWYHVVLAVDLTQGTQSNRGKIWVNGVQQSLSTNDLPDSSSNTKFTDDRLRYLGARSFDGSPSSYFDGYMAEIHFCDGTAYDADDFGELKSGVWVPKSPSVSYGTTGFYLEFAGNANDSSGNGNNWTANNISSYDYVPDSPTQNFCTMNPLDKSSAATLSEGNLRISQGASQGTTFGTVGVSSGKYYFEVRINTHANEIIGIVPETQSPSLAHPGSGSNSGFGYDTTSGRYYEDNAQDTGHATAGAGDVVMIAFDLDNSSIWAGVNGSWNEGDPSAGTGSPYTGLSSGTTYLVGTRPYNANITFNFGQDSTFLGNETAGGNSDANGIGDFKYSVPTGYLALSTANLTVAQAVDPAEDNSPQDYFNTVLWTGNGSTQSITGVGFQPDWVWIKNRGATNSHGLYDTVRGATNFLSSDSTGAEATSAITLTSFDSDGFSLGSSNQVNGAYSYVAWNWKANGSGVSNTEGSITSTVSANTESGFSIVSYTGSTNESVGHGLDQAPECIFVKDRDATSNWAVYHQGVQDVTANGFLELNTTAATATGSNPRFLSGTAGTSQPTSTVFYVNNYSGSTTNNTGNDYIAYCFHSVEGFSKFGSYTGNGSNDGPFVYCGFRPAFIIIKNVDAVKNWYTFDDTRQTYNVLDDLLAPNLSDAETSNTGTYLDILSNGFKLRQSFSHLNTSGQDCIFMAFASNPFKYSNAR